jgi:type IV secretory pathway TraG/TraD family ATPase VirD4
VFVVFDSKGDFLAEFYRPGDAVVSNAPEDVDGRVLWNVFADIGSPEDPSVADEIFEVASTIFGDGLAAAGQNMFFAAGARDLFAAALEALHRQPTPHSNADLRNTLEGSNEQLFQLITAHQDLAGNSRYLRGSGNTPESIRAFLQQSVNSAFSGVFRRSGDFSVRDFVRQRQARALFIEYDIATGSRLTPVYRVLIDLAIKEALSLGRRGQRGNVHFVMDEFSLVPLLEHLSDGINFGRSLGLKFVVGTQNVEQVLFAYGSELGRTILSGFATVFAFRLMDDVSRDLVKQRFGANRKHITIDAAVRAQGVQQETVLGNVVEDWVLSSLTLGRCVVTLPTGPPFLFAFDAYRRPSTT